MVDDDDSSQASIASQLTGPTGSRLRWSAEYFEENFKCDNSVSLLELVGSPYFKVFPAIGFGSLTSDTSSLTPWSTPLELECMSAPSRTTPDWSERMEVLANTSFNVRAQADLDVGYWEGILKARQAKPKVLVPQERWNCAEIRPILLDTAFEIDPGHPNWSAIMEAKEEMEEKRETDQKRRTSSTVDEEEPDRKSPNKRLKKVHSWRLLENSREEVEVVAYSKYGLWETYLYA